MTARSLVRVLPGARTSPSNSPTTAPADSGVDYGCVAPEDPYTPGPVVNPAGVRMAQQPLQFSGGPVGWALWAVRTGPLHWDPTASWTTGARALAGIGTRTVLDPSAPEGTRTDGAGVVSVIDAWGGLPRSVRELTYSRGTEGSPVTWTSAGGDFSYDSATGNLTLNDTPRVRGAVGVRPGDPVAVSRTRGDAFTAVVWVPCTALFRWSRNDPARIRLKWDPAIRTWSLKPGTSPRLMGRMGSESNWELRGCVLPPAGQYLPGDPTRGAWVRVGAEPGESSFPVVERTSGEWSGIRVVPDSELGNPAWDGSSPPDAARVAEGSGQLVWNPGFVSAMNGVQVWFCHPEFTEDMDGRVGVLSDSSFYLSPIPEAGESPALRLGERAHLTAHAVSDETTLGALGAPSAGSFYWARSTGKIRLSPADISRADPGTRESPNPDWDPNYLECPVLYDGVYCGSRAQPATPAVAVLDSGGVAVTSYVPGQELYIPDSLLAPGLGKAGVALVPDGTGRVPLAGFVPGVRPGESGLVRDPNPSPGTHYLMARGRRVARVEVVDRDQELPTDLYSLRSDTVWVSREKGTWGSRLVCSLELQQALAGSPLWWARAQLVPAYHTGFSVFWSRAPGPYELDGTEEVSLRVGGALVTWPVGSQLGAGTHSTESVAGACAATLGSAEVPAHAYLDGHHWRIEGTFFSSTPMALNWEPEWSRVGMVPGWVAAPAESTGEPDDPNWQPDTGLGFGLSLSPTNPAGTQPVADVRCLYRVEDQDMGTVEARPFQFLIQTPRQDLPGYAPGVYYSVRASSSGSPQLLKPWQQVQYFFDSKRLGWLQSETLAGEVTAATSGLELGPGAQAVTLGFGLGGRVQVSLRGGPARYYELGRDCFLDSYGQLQLGTPKGELKSQGWGGAWEAGGAVFTDSDNPWTSTGKAQAGDWLRVGGDSAPLWYRVARVAATGELEVTPSFPVVPASQVPWQVFRGALPGEVDPTVVADASWVEMSPQETEPMEIRVLTPLGLAGSELSRVPPAVVAQAPAGSLGLRWGAEGTSMEPEILSDRGLGTLGGDSLAVPEGFYLTDQRFDLRVGARLWVQGEDLVGVESFSPDPGDRVEYLAAGPGVGTLKFGSRVRDLYLGAPVAWVPRVLGGDRIPEGSCQLDSDTGEVGFATADLERETGNPVFFSEWKFGSEVELNPVAATFTLSHPLAPGQWVEACYFRAAQDSGELLLDNQGHPIRVKERVARTVRRERAQRVSSQLYTYNPTRMTEAPVSASVYVGSRRVTYGVPPGARVESSTRTISLVQPVADSAQVSITYAVYEAAGGETSFSLTRGPVWRPPFRLEAGSSEFSLSGDRIAELPLGAPVRVGGWLTYVYSRAYSASLDTTRVTVWPAATTAVGSLNASNPELCLVGDRSLTPEVNPGGSGTVVTGAGSSYMPTAAQLLGLAGGVPMFAPLARGAVAVMVTGDLTSKGPGHVLELRGYPFLVTGAARTPDGLGTRLELATPLPFSWEWSAGLLASEFRISARPLYPHGARQLTLGSASVPGQPVRVVRHRAGEAGQELQAGTDYQFDPSSGYLLLVEPRQPGLEVGEQVRVHRTDAETWTPLQVRGQTVYPRVQIQYSSRSVPSARGGLLGARLMGSYTFEARDAFYALSVPLEEWSSKASGLGSDPQFPWSSTGPLGAESSGVSGELPDGVLGPAAGVQEARVRDQAARYHWSRYGEVVEFFEQLLENWSGETVGGTRGKFRSWVGRGNFWTPPGHEDPVRGRMNPRNVWLQTLQESPPGPGVLIEADPLLDPASAEWTGGYPQGSVPTGPRRAELESNQRLAVRNELDDRFLVGSGPVRGVPVSPLSTRWEASPRYLPLAEPSPGSRIYPERVGVVTVTGPGIGATAASPGVFSAGTQGPAGTWVSTRGQAIAQLAAPAWGALTGVSGVRLRRRRARAHILGWEPRGYAWSAGSAGRPAIWATPLRPEEFPRDAEGNPRLDLLAAQAGTSSGLGDLSTGGPELSNPPFKAGDRVAWGNSSGARYVLGWRGATVGGQWAPVMVEEVLSGCVVLLGSQSSGGTPVSVLDADQLVALTGANTGIPFDPREGDTLYGVPGTYLVPGSADPPTTAQLTAAAAGLDMFRIGFDVELKTATGELVDCSLPSSTDPAPVPLQQLLGQNPPTPGMAIEGEADFVSLRSEPEDRIPALRGEFTEDSGDSPNPYLYFPDNEVSGLVRGGRAAVEILSGDTVSPAVGNPPPNGLAPYEVEARYPEEIRGTQGRVDPADPTYPAALLTQTPLNPGSASYPSPGGAGTGQLRPGDLVMVQVGTSGSPELPAGSTGILSVGRVADGATGVVEPPRFVSPVNAGSGIQISIANLNCWCTAPEYSSGAVVTEDTATPGAVVTRVDVSSINPSYLVWDDGVGGGSGPAPVGGFNTFMAEAPVGSTVTLTLCSRATGLKVPGAALICRKTATGPSLNDCSFEVSGDAGSTWTPVNAGGVHWETQLWTLVTPLPFFDFSPFDSASPSPSYTLTGGYHDFVVDADASLSTGSPSYWIGMDRLTLGGPVDPRTARPRGTLSPAGESLQLEVYLGSCGARLYNPSTPGWVGVRSTVNSSSELNASSAWTFPYRASQGEFGVGVFDTSQGLVRVAAWEGSGNQPIESEGIVWAALPTARSDSEGPLLVADAVADALDSPSAPSPWVRDGRIRVETVLKGSLDRVGPGDLVWVPGQDSDMGSSAPIATTKAGTYLVRAVMVANTGLAERRIQLKAESGDPGSWVPFRFPQVQEVSGSGVSLQLRVDSLPRSEALLSSTGTPVDTSGGLFPVSGRLFLILRPQDLSSTSAAEYRKAVYSAAYSGLDLNEGVFSGLADFQDGLGDPVTEETFAGAAQAGTPVSGMARVPVRAAAQGLPPELPGYHCSTGPGAAVLGCRTLTVYRVGLTALDYLAAGTRLVAAVGGTEVHPLQREAQSATVPGAPGIAVYQNVLGGWDLSTLDWDRVHATTGSWVPAGTRCLLPGDFFTLDYSGAAGLYLEPSFPRPTQNLGGLRPRVTDAGHVPLLAEVGMRDLSSVSGATPPAGESLQELVRLEVRRARRWSGASVRFQQALEGLRFAYEIRRGIVQEVSAAGPFFLLTALPVDGGNPPKFSASGGGTQLGSFLDPRVGVHSGATVQWLDSEGLATSSTEIVSVEGDRVLRLAPCTVEVAPGTRFEIFLSRGLVPQEQTLRQLTQATVEDTVLKRDPRAEVPSGGKVPWVAGEGDQDSYDQSCNRLQDCDETLDYQLSGVAPGDFVWVPPAGTLRGPGGPASPPEQGRPPQGDAGTRGRPAAWVPGSPSALDDNRGFYWVQEVQARELRVGAAPVYVVGDRSTGDQIWGPESTTPTVLYPTVNGSLLSGAREGQGDLRPTSPADSDQSYAGSPYSVEPFGYQVLRPRAGLTPQMVQLVWCARERFLSWGECLAPGWDGGCGSSYYQFQLGNQCSDLGDPARPPSVRGVSPNGWLQGLVGRTEWAPLATSSTCLSFPERRWWAGDPSLAYSVPPLVDWAGGTGHPSGRDLLQQVLNGESGFRSLRDAWARVRAHRTRGTLGEVRRALEAARDAASQEEAALRARSS